MGEWSNLTQREKSNIIRFAIKNGVSDINTIRDTFNVYAGGGHLHEGTKSDSKLHIPTREEYITQKLDSIQNAALEVSRRKTQAQTTPVYARDVYGQKYVTDVVLKGYVEDARNQVERLRAQERFRAKKNNSPEFIQGNTNTAYQSVRLAEAEKSLETAEKMLNGEIKYDGPTLSNCIANLSEFFPHGLPYGNETFSNNPKKYGFSLIDTWDVKPGDLVQKVGYSGRVHVPHHAMIYNGVDSKGEPTFNYSNGGMPYTIPNEFTGKVDTVGGYGVGKYYPDAVAKDKEHLWDVNVYRYTGTPQDSAMWTNEWLQKYGTGAEFSSGGKIHIDPSKKGTFTAAASKHGKSVQAFASQVLAHKENYSPAMVRKANFARNSAKWHKHEDGGDNNAEYSIIDYLRDLRNLLNSKEEDRLTSNISLSPAFYNKSVELASSPLYKPVLKGIAKRAMHQSSYPTRSIENFKKAIFEPDTYKYTGGVDYYSGGWDNRKRDLVSLFINGKPDRGSDLQSLEGEDSRGFDYGDFIATHYPNKTIKTYEGIFPLRGTIQVSPSGYELAKFLGSNLSNIGHYKNAGSAPSASDNVASYRTHYNVWKGEPELIQTDLWDFGGDYNNTWNSKNSDFKRLQSEVINTIGTPFILKSINPIRVSSTPDEEFENQMAREADAANVLRYDSDSDTYNTLLSLPELTVGRLRNFMFEEGERATTFSTGGPLYPFSFSKNPYWKTPIVRYDKGGILGHRYGIGDFLSKLFAPTYSGDFSTAFANARNDGNSYFKWNGNRYSTQWETEKYREDHPEEYVPEFAYTDAMNRIAREENAKLVKNGYIPELDAWQPHESVEGGAKTIGYGLKLGPHNQAVLDELERNKSAKYPNGYISDAFALQQSADLLREEYEPLAKKYWNSTFNDDSWDNLSPKMKSIILDYQYNVKGGIKEFPKLMRAIHDKDYDGIKANYKRYANKRELGRNKGIYQDLERLFGGYYSVYND